MARSARSCAGLGSRSALPSTSPARLASSSAREVRVIPSPVEIPESVGEPDDPPHVLFVGRLSPEKGIHEFLAATEGLPPRDRRRRAGRRPRGGRLRPSRRARVVLRARRTRLRPSRREGYGFVAREAMAHGRPVVATAVGGLADAVEDGVTGVLVRSTPPRCASRRAPACRRELRARLGAAARDRARSEFGVGSAATRGRLGVRAQCPAMTSEACADHRHRRPGRLAARRAAAGAGLRGLRHRPPADVGAVSEPRRGRGTAIELIQADLLDELSLVDALETSQPHEVYNLAAPSFVPMSWEQPALTAEFAAVGATALLEAVRLIDAETRGSTRPRRVRSSASRSDAPQTEDDARRAADAVRRREGVLVLHRALVSAPLRPARSSGILYNHESPRRPLDFLPRKVANGAARISLGLAGRRSCSATSTRAATGAYAGDYVRAMWLMLQQDEPDDYVIATGRHPLASRSSSECAFAHVGLDWRGPRPGRRVAATRQGRASVTSSATRERRRAASAGSRRWTSPRSCACSSTPISRRSGIVDAAGRDVSVATSGTGLARAARSRSAPLTTIDLILTSAIAIVLLPEVVSRAAVERDTKEIPRRQVAVRRLHLACGTGRRVRGAINSGSVVWIRQRVEPPARHERRRRQRSSVLRHPPRLRGVRGGRSAEPRSQPG